MNDLLNKLYIQQDNKSNFVNLYNFISTKLDTTVQRSGVG